ncbi:TKL/LISK/LISK-DD1 protein kinase [Sphaeroforma arctica JP610]|uniref:TKL/LISK/LISK-DD1 protein kinase n=1 Tax=Sphaeroforma arctica JP610 TaxID=667725 RepID=A0A0L0GG45_9EUKA|nr:TKL/LISK/LISK-DD1 protein kinase [Sphaeroforma arctica JP610]KNC87796.1 TKL/LISK/LISK-DD1 protein kinase [Sphaeroforma arctica JP610]|eukprot:XP_014161698.1 TKL/LISK/LISK-DD1 protein kinase [Sphaeroforma arctica JP610]
MYIVTEYLGGGTLQEYINDASRVKTWHQRVSFAIDGARALAYIHMKGITHRDLKSENFLLTENNRLKLTDFGLSRKISTMKDDRMSYCGTEYMQAPELLMCIDFDHRVDVFSFGLVLLELILNQTHSEDNHLLDRDFRTLGLKLDDVKGSIPHDCPTELTELALLCCSVEKEERPSFKEILAKLRHIEAQPPKENTNVGALAQVDSTGSNVSLSAESGCQISTSDICSRSGSATVTIPERGASTPQIEFAPVNRPSSVPPTGANTAVLPDISNETRSASLNSIHNTAPKRAPSTIKRTARHHIPHRFSIINKSTRIAVLGEMLTRNCDIFTHVRCSVNMPASCQLSPGLEKMALSQNAMNAEHNSSHSAVSFNPVTTAMSPAHSRRAPP